MTRIIDRTGQKFTTNKGDTIEIIECFGVRNYTVRFEDGTIVTNIQYVDIQRGYVKNPFHPIVFGVGYFGQGHYKANINKRSTKSYQTWLGMLERCYCPKSKLKSPTYIGCTVDERWHNFQVFAQWFEENYREGQHLDKDILLKGNKIYSPDTCCFVPHRVNVLFTKTNKKRGDLPIGVSYSKAQQKYKATISIDSIGVHLGFYNSPTEAFIAYKTAKETYIKEIANKYKDTVTTEYYNALMNYEVEITD